MGLRNAAVYEKEEEKAETRVVVMEWEKQQQVEDGGGGGGGGGGSVFYVKVMTDDQMELLRRQISVYATICEQLVDMHKALTSHQDSLAGIGLGNIYYDPLMVSAGHKITASRQRWTPSPMQLQILENIFDQGNGTPNKVRIKEITSELTQHGPISETNVYNWFQNRRARSKRKQLLTQTNNGDSEAETEIESPKEKKAKSEYNILSSENPFSRADDSCFHSLEVSSEAHSLDPETNKSRGTLQSKDCPRSSSSFSHASFFDNIISNPRMENPRGKMADPGCFNPFRTSEGFNVIQG